MTDIHKNIVDYLDSMRNGVPMTVMAEDMHMFDVEDLKAATKELFDDRRINRVSVKGGNGRFFYVFFSLYTHTVGGHRLDEAPTHANLAPAPEPERELIAAEKAPTDSVVAELVVAPVLSPEEAVDVLRRGGWEPEPETVVRPVERRVARLTAMEVIDRWKLPYRLSRIIEIVSAARRRDLGAEDAAMVTGLIRDHVKGGQ